MDRRLWILVGGCFTLVLALIGGIVWWQYVSYVPPVASPQTNLPVPNARDDFLAAIQLLPADNATKVKNLNGACGRNDGRLLVTTPQLRKIVADAQPALQRLRAGLGHEFGTPPVLSFNQEFPELEQFRRLARLLAAESELALRERRPKAALRSGLNTIKMGGQAQRGGPLVHGLVGLAVGAIGLRSVENAVDFADADACAQSARELWSLDARAPTVADALTGERDSVLPILAQISRGFVPRAGSQTPPQSGGAASSEDWEKAVQFFVTPKRQILENYRRYLDAAIDRARKPYQAQGHLSADALDPLSAIVAPVYEDARFAWGRQEALRHVLLTRLAVRAYTLREGHPPASLRELVPKYLPGVPADPFAPAPLVYRVVQGQPLVYSRGPDGDDDGGRDLGSSSKPNSDGDLASTRRPASR